MSYPGVDPADATTTSPVGTQDASAGEPQKLKYDHVELPDGTMRLDPQPVEHSGSTTQAQPIEVPEQTPEQKEALNKAVKEAFSDMFAVTQAWEPREVVKFVIECPSGQKALAKHLDVLDLAAADLVEDMDLFTRKLFPTALDDQGNPVDNKDQESFWKALKDINKRLKFIDMTNRLMAAASVKPKVVNDGVAIRTNPETSEQEIVHGYQVTDIDEQLKLFGKPVPTLGDPRHEAYAGTITFNDRMTFFTELQKPLALIEPFREQQDAVLANLESSESVGNTAERPV